MFSPLNRFYKLESRKIGFQIFKTQKMISLWHHSYSAPANFDQDTALRIHNELKALEAAANMQELVRFWNSGNFLEFREFSGIPEFSEFSKIPKFFQVWDPALASLAQSWANQCNLRKRPEIDRLFTAGYDFVGKSMIFIQFFRLILTVFRNFLRTQQLEANNF